MMRLLKIIISLVLIIFLTFIGLLTFIDPNRYKTDIVNEVQKSINQPFSIHGEIKWHFWPEFGLLLEDARIGKPKEMLQIKHMNVVVQLLPLLRQQVDMRIKDFSIHWQHENKETFDANIENINVKVQGLSRAEKQITVDTVLIDYLDMNKIYFDMLAMLSTLTADHIIINHFTMSGFMLNKMKLAAIDTHIDLNHGIMTLKPFNAELFKGKLTGEMMLNLNNPNPDAQINAHLKQADLSPLLTYMAADNEITGTIDMDLKITSAGLDSLLMQQQAEGSAHIGIEKCIYHGSHFDKVMLDTASSPHNLKDAVAILADTLPLSEAMIAQNHEGNKITGTMNIHQGRVDALDLMLNEQYPIKRYGNIDLAHELINLCFDFQKKF